MALGKQLFGGIEAGGTKFVCGVGTGPSDLKTARFSTRKPAETVADVIDFFEKETNGNLQSIGIGSFGPIDLDRQSPTYGHVTSTPKIGWQNFDLAGALQHAFNVPVGFHTDVAAAALGEARWGATQGLSDSLYLTIGTGIGGAAIVNNQVMRGLVHSEMGHITLPHDRDEDPYAGWCTYHGDCLEGLASGPAMQGRWGVPGRELPTDHKAWQLEAKYLAAALVTFVCTLSPKRIVLGGGVMQQEHLFEAVRSQFLEKINGYVQHDAILKHVDRYIVPPQLGGDAGVLGAFVLAEQALRIKAVA